MDISSRALAAPRMPKRSVFHATSTRSLAGLAVFLILLSVYLPSSPWSAMRIGLERSGARAVSAVSPPKGATRMIQVPFHKQQHALSCELASLRSALLALRIDVSEDILLGMLPMDPSPKRWTSRTAFTWGDPNTGFVGNVNGRMPSTGYGVYAGPIAEVASSYASTTRIRSNDAAALVRAIDAGHPVIAWTALGSRPRTITWKTAEGVSVKGAMYEHTVVVKGYRGTAQRMERVYLVDPLTGTRSETWSEFTRRTAYLDYQALEIRPAGD